MIRNKKLQEIDLALNSLVVFRRLLTNEVVLPLRGLLDTETMDPVIQLRKYTEFLSRLYVRSTNLSEYIFGLICEDDNFYVRAKAAGKEVSDVLDACVQNELAILQRLARLRPYELQKEISYYGILPEWDTAEIDFGAAYHERLRELHKYGFGQYVRNPMFTAEDGKVVPVKYPDTVQLTDLFGYTRERQAVIDNVKVLLSGHPAQNMLLYGDAGTGKSATVKAVVNAYFPEGLRLIQITKEQLPSLPAVLDEIHGNPLKFLLFIDDLTLGEADSGFGTLKATLEGSVSARPENAVIVATSNRRHILRERFSDREGDEVHRNDTLQEQASLAARFGLRVNFAKPDKRGYLELVQALGEAQGLALPQEELAQEAEQFALRAGGRSPRAAKQIVEQIAAAKGAFAAAEGCSES